MLIKDFITLVLNKLEKLEKPVFSALEKKERSRFDEPKDSDEFLESQETSLALKQLCQKYADSDEPLVDHKQLHEFYDFLHARWERNAGTNRAYAVSPHSKGNLCCQALANTLIYLPHQLQGAPRNPNSILTHSISMHVFARQLWDELEMLPPEATAEYGLIATVISQNTVASLKALLVEYADSAEPVTVGALKTFRQFIIDRPVAGTHFDYDKAPDLCGNLACVMLAQKIAIFNNVNEASYLDYDPQALLNEGSASSALERTKATQYLIDEILKSLENYQVQVNHDSINLQNFARYMLSEMKKVHDVQPTDLAAYRYYESKITLLEMEPLLKKYVHAADTFPSSDALQPFYHFFKRRWERIAGRTESYQFTPHSPVNLLCETMSEQLMLLYERAGLSNINKNGILKPVVHVSDFAKKLLTELDNLPAENPMDMGLFVYLESQATLIRIRQMVLASIDNHAFAHMSTLTSFIRFLQERANKIAKTPADPHSNPDTLANKYCAFMAKQLVTYADTNQPSLLQADHLFNPSQQEENALPAPRFIERMIGELKQDEAYAVELKKSVKLTMREFGAQLLHQLSAIPADKADAMDWDVYLESYQAGEKLNNILVYLALQNPGEEISRKSLEIFTEYLKDRSARIENTKASQQFNPLTYANQACRLLVDHLFAIGLLANVRLKERELLLTPITAPKEKQKDPDLVFKKSVVSEIKTQAQFIALASLINRSDWGHYVSAFDVASLRNIVKGDAASYEAFLEKPDFYTANEDHSKVILLANYECYCKTRKMQGSYKSITGLLFSPIKTVYNETQKTLAAREAQAYLGRGDSLHDFVAALDDPSSPLFKHRDCLLQAGSELNKCTQHVFTAAAQLPKTPKLQHTDRVVAKRCA